MFRSSPTPPRVAYPLDAHAVELVAPGQSRHLEVADTREAECGHFVGTLRSAEDRHLPHGLVESGVGCAEELWISEGFAEPTGQVGAGGLEDLEHVVAGDALYKVRGMLHTRSCLLTLRQQHRILDLSASDCHVALEVTWSAYQNIIDAYRAPDTSAGKVLMEVEINTLTSTRVPRNLTELMTLGRTLKHRAEHSAKQEDSGPNYTPDYEEPQKMSQPWEFPPVFTLIRALELGYVNDHRRLSDNELHAARGADARPHTGAIPAAP